MNGETCYRQQERWTEPIHSASSSCEVSLILILNSFKILSIACVHYGFTCTVNLNCSNLSKLEDYIRRDIN